MPAHVGDILISSDAIARRVAELGAELGRTYADREPVLVAIMKGCIVFLADLVRAWPGPMDLEVVTAQSYDGVKAGAIRLDVAHDFARHVAGRPVIIIDDICDTGGTLTAVSDAIRAMGPAEIRTLVLLRRRAAVAGACKPPQCRPDWVGFEIDDGFVVGYGLDYHGRYRNLPHIAMLEGYRSD
jgi:hypoxanthine phosphoribosyltransferase